ncbi:nitroreductase family protein [Nocardia sp. CDC159]|uniref:Nitroreductase family protein n=1 Tax=Nocardia pulmonis TaxID=2951408 RepID=A0A9X2E9E3_9NOCA|nr:MULTISPECIES: nitroreductase family protein [Nocardia]MCM6776712.1 nitroreductase family protein [Nocardia pulmonis]MCM6789139.1 nitroreductase family protein [Nocardia sp. CDC159]
MDEAITTLRSVRHFQPNPVPRVTIEQVINVARWTGSARNRQPWRFVAVTDPRMRGALSRFGDYAMLLSRAPLVLVLLSEDNGMGDTEFDLGRIAQSVCLAAQQRGLGSCVTTFHPDENVRQAADILAAPPGWLPRHAIALGYTDDENHRSPTAIPLGRLSVDDLLTWVP